MAGNCPVCGKEMIEGCLVSCGTCETLHHKDCWEYNKGCATYACKSKDLPAKVEDIGIFRCLLNWLVSLVYTSPEEKMAREKEERESAFKSYLNYALNEASGKGSVKIMNLLLKKGAVPCKNCLSAAINSHNLNAVNILIENGASVINCHITQAARSGSEDILDIVLKSLEQN